MNILRISTFLLFINVAYLSAKPQRGGQHAIIFEDEVRTANGPVSLRVSEGSTKLEYKPNPTDTSIGISLYGERKTITEFLRDIVKPSVLNDILPGLEPVGREPAHVPFANSPTTKPCSTTNDEYKCGRNAFCESVALRGGREVNICKCNAGFYGKPYEECYDTPLPSKALSFKPSSIFQEFFEEQYVGFCRHYVREVSFSEDLDACSVDCVSKGEFCVGVCFEPATTICTTYSLLNRTEGLFVKNHFAYKKGSKLSHEAAKKTCKNISMAMSLPVTKREESLYNTEYYHIGASDSYDEGVFHRDSDGEVLTYFAAWRDGEPNNAKKDENDKKGEDCISVNDHTWNDIPCEFEFEYYCQWPIPGKCMDAPKGDDIKPGQVCYKKF